MDNNVLEHHGIKGQRWGVRRYQNKDGTLTNRGKKRYAAEMEKLKKEEQVLKNRQRTQAKIDKLLKKRQDLDELRKSLDAKSDNPVKKKIKSDIETKVKKHSKEKPKSVKDMTDEELTAHVNRLRLEQTYAQLTAKPEIKKEISGGKKFINDALSTIGRKTVEKVAEAIGDKAKQTAKEMLGVKEQNNKVKIKTNLKKK